MKLLWECMLINLTSAPKVPEGWRKTWCAAVQDCGRWHFHPYRKQSLLSTFTPKSARVDGLHHNGNGNHGWFSGNKNTTLGVWRDGSGLKSKHLCAFRGPGFNSKYPHGGSQMSVILSQMIYYPHLASTGTRHAHGTQAFMKTKHLYARIFKIEMYFVNGTLSALHPQLG